MKALDLFCGLGGWSDGLALEGFEVMGVEIESKIAKLYKHPIIVEDVCNLQGSQFPGYDLIVGSPPCRDFSIMCDKGHFGRGYGSWKIPKNPAKGLELVNAFLKIVQEAEPTYWLLENVPYLQGYLNLKPQCVAKLGKTMKRAFWGNFPPFLVPMDMRKPLMTKIQGPLRKWERAKIPLPVSRALARAVLNEYANFSSR